MTTYWGQYYVAIYLATFPLALFTTENVDYGSDAWTWGDNFVITWILGAIVGTGAIVDLINKKKKQRYIDKLDKYSHLSEKRIEAKPDEVTGKLDVYEKTRSIHGQTSVKLRTFHPEDELEECLDFVNNERAAIKSKKLELAPAKSVAKLINEGK